MPGPENEDHAARTLIVDDDPDVARLIQAQLRAVGIPADTTESPEDALSMIAKGSYCVIVCDIDMPVMDGIELAGRIKRFDPVIQIVCSPPSRHSPGPLRRSIGERLIC